MRVCRECAELPAFFVGRKVGEKSGRQRERISGSGRDSVGGILLGFREGGENTGTPEGEDIGSGKDSVGGYN